MQTLMELWEVRLILSDLGQSNQAAVSELSLLQLKMDRVGGLYKGLSLF